MKAAVLMISLLIFCSFSLIACAWQKTIVGKWQQIGGSETMEFFKDGTITNSGGPMPLAGKYVLLDDKRLKIEFGGMGALAGPVVATYEISGDELTLTAPSGQVGKYRRAD